MKDLKDIIQEKLIYHQQVDEKLIINKDSTLSNPLNTKFKDIDDFINTLNYYFKDKLLTDKIIIHHEKTCLRDIMSFRSAGQEVLGYGYITFNNDTFIRLGLVKGGEKVLMQSGYYKDGIKKYDEKMTEFAAGYEFKKENFEEWLKSYKHDYPELVKKFINIGE